MVVPIDIATDHAFRQVRSRGEFKKPNPPHKPMKSTFRLQFRLSSITALTISGHLAAATFTYTPSAGTSDLWSAGTNWDAPPVGAGDTRLTFVSGNATVLPDDILNTSTNDLAGDFQINILDLQGTGPAAGAGTVNIAGTPPSTGLALAGTNPAVNLNALAGVAGLTYDIAPTLTLNANATVTGAGTANFNLNGGLSGSAFTLTKGGTSVLNLGSASNLGSLTIGNVQDGGRIVVKTGSSMAIGDGSGNNLLIATKVSEATAARGTLDLSAAAGFTANVARVELGFTNNSANSQGILNLSPDNAITATTSFIVGNSNAAANAIESMVTTPADSSSVINTPSFIVSSNKSRGSFTLGADSLLEVRGATGSGSRATIIVGRTGNGGGGAGPYHGIADFSAGEFRADLNKLIVGERVPGDISNSGQEAQGTLTLGGPVNYLNIAGTGTVVEIGKFALNGSAATAKATGTVTLENLSHGSIIESTNNATAILLGQSTIAGRSTGTLNLNGGALILKTTGAAIAGHANGNANVKFNGPTLIAGAGSANWITGLTEAAISDGGLRIDTNNFNITIPQNLGHDSSGAPVDGGLTKTWAGMLTLSGTNTYTGPTSVESGMLFLTGTGALPSGSDLTIEDGGGLGLNIGGAGEFSLAQLETWRTDGTFLGADHSIGIGTANAGGDPVYTSSLPTMLDLFKTGANKLTLANSTEIKGSLRIGINATGGTLAAGAGATMSIGSGFGGQLAIGVTNTATQASGVLDASAANSFTADVANIIIGSAQNNAVTGSGILRLPANSSLTASSSIVVGNSSGAFNSDLSEITTADGGTAEIITPAMTFGGVKSRALFTLGTGATLNLSAPFDSRMALVLGSSAIEGGSATTWYGDMNLAPGSLNAKLSGLLLGHTDAGSGSWTSEGTLTTGGSSNHIDIEGPGTTVVAGRWVSGNGVNTARGTLTLTNPDATSSITSTDNGTAILLGTGGSPGNHKASGTLNLTGGSLTITTTGSAIRGDTANASNLSTVNFDGVTLRAGAPSSDWISGLSTANIAGGGLTIDTASHDIGIPQAFSGAGSLTKAGDGILALTVTSSHAGDTTVSGGTLSLATEMLDDASDIHVAAGALLHLDYPETTVDTVNSLTLAGNLVTPGIWGAAGSGAPKTSPLITGTGRLNVLTGAIGGDAYEEWASVIPDPDERARTDDPDGDGFTNLEEFLFGTSPIAANGSPVQTTTSGANLVIRWNQRDEDASYQLQESTTMAEIPWPASGVVPLAAADQSGVPSDYTRMEATVPIDVARKFLRVGAAED